MAMMDITVKTLDGQNRTFSVPESATVRSFKEKISSSIEIPADTQRLIFHGRVMQDEKNLKDYDVHGKVIHVVQRAPPSSVSGTSTSSTPTTSTSTPTTGRTHVEGGFDVQIHLGNLNPTPSTREARSRIRQAELNIGIINGALNLLEERAGITINDCPPADNPPQNCAEESMDTSAPETQSGSQPQAGQEPENPRQEIQEVLLATELADVMDRVLSTNDRITPHLRLYRNYLRNEQRYQSSSQEARNAQEVVNRVSEAIHAMSHMMHNLSEVMVDMNSAPPRNAIAHPPQPFSMPGGTTMAIPIHMNVRSRQGGNGNRTQQQPQSNQESGGEATPNTSAASSAARTSAGNTSSTATATNATAETGISFNTDMGNVQVNSTTIPLPEGVLNAGNAHGVVGVVQDVRAVITGEFEGADADAAGSTSDTTITVVSATTNQPISSAATFGTTSAATSSTTGAPNVSTGSRNAGQGQGTATPASATAGFSFGPTTNVNIGGIPNLNLGNLPNVPGLPTGMLQNILPSMLSTHGIPPGQRVQVHVLPPTMLSFGGMQANNGAGSNNASQQTPASMDASTATRHNVATNTSMNNTVTTGTNTLNNSSGDQRPNAPDRSTYSSNVGTGTDPNIGTNSQSTNTPRPTIHIHQGGRPHLHGVRGRGIPQRFPHAGAGLRHGTPEGLQQRAFVDMYLPCASHHYNSQTARQAARTYRAQMNEAGQASQQVPNLSTMVSGMVGDLIGQVNQAAQQSRNGGQATSTSASSSGTTTFTTRTTTTGSSGESTTGSNRAQSQGPGMPLPFDLETIMSTLRGAVNPTAANSNRGDGAPSGGTLSDLFRQFGSSGDRSHSNLIVSILEAIAPHMRLTDLFSLMMGNTAVLGQVRAPLRDYVQSRIRELGSVERTAQTALDDMWSEILHIQSLVQVRDGVNMAQSIRTCLYVHTEKILRAIASETPASQESFGRELYSLWMNMLAELIGLCVYCIRDGQTGFSNMMRQYMPRMTQGMDPAITIWMTTSLQEILTSFHQNHPVPETDILQYVINTSSSHPEQEKPKPAATQQTGTSAPPSKQTEPKTAEDSDAKGGASGSSKPKEPSAPAIAPMDLSQSSSSQPTRAKVPQTLPVKDSEPKEEFVDALDGLNNDASSHSENAKSGAAKNGRAQKKSAVNGQNGDNWEAVVPQDWIPVIRTDIERQQGQRSQPPLSDAYLQGLPAKRRRMMVWEHAGEMGNMPQYFPSSVARAARTAGVQPISSEQNLMQEASDDQEIQKELDHEMQSVLQSRISSDQDFISERFPNANKYFHKSKRH